MGFLIKHVGCKVRDETEEQMPSSPAAYSGNRSFSHKLNELSYTAAFCTYRVAQGEVIDISHGPKATGITGATEKPWLSPFSSIFPFFA
jgi:hypothetical protein